MGEKLYCLGRSAGCWLLFQPLVPLTDTSSLAPWVVGPVLKYFVASENVEWPVTAVQNGPVRNLRGSAGISTTHVLKYSVHMESKKPAEFYAAQRPWRKWAAQG